MFAVYSETETDGYNKPDCIYLCLCDKIWN